MRRFIRYLYEYGQGKKVRNVGFVNVEQGGEETTLHIHGKGLRLTGGDALGLYLCWKEDGGLVGTYQGEIAFMGPAVNYRLHYTKEDTGGEENYGTAAGILLKDRNGRTFAAMWEDEPVDVERMPCREKFVRPEEAGRHTETEAAPEPAADELLKPELISKPGIDELLKPEPEAASEADADEPRERELETEAASKPGADEVRKPEAEGAPELGADEMRQPETDVVPGTGRKQGAAQEIPEPVSDVVDAGAESASLDSIGADVRVQAEEKEEACPWKVTKIQRSDIARLPRCEWRLANNHFLLHGYRNYRYLALLDDGRVLRLGVPGIYHVKEARAASGFGFPEFIHADEIRQAADDEEREEEEKFGYWCRQVRRPRE